jgi:hypothetical protein
VRPKEGEENFVYRHLDRFFAEYGNFNNGPTIRNKKQSWKQRELSQLEDGNGSDDTPSVRHRALASGVACKGTNPRE